MRIFTQSDWYYSRQKFKREHWNLQCIWHNVWKYIINIKLSPIPIRINYNRIIVLNLPHTFLLWLINNTRIPYEMWKTKYVPYVQPVFDQSSRQTTASKTDSQKHKQKHNYLRQIQGAAVKLAFFFNLFFLPI